MPRFPLSCIALLLLGLAATAQAQSPSFPAGKPVKIQVGAAAGGGSDTLSRAFATVLNERWNSPVVVENIPGAQGAIAHRRLAMAPPDGYTLQLGASGTALLGVFNKVPFDPRTAFEFIAQVTKGSYLVLLNPKIPASNFKQFVAYARANPGKLDYGSTGVGGAGFMASEYLKYVTGMYIVHIPYQGLGPAMNDLTAGRISMILNSPASASPLIKSGRIRAIAVTGAERMSGFPDVPTVAESGYPDYALQTYYGVIGPAGMKPEVLNFLNREIIAAANSKQLKDKLEEGTEVMGPHPPSAFKALFLKEYAAYDKLQKMLKIEVAD